MGKGPRIDCSKDVPLTQQSDKDAADINQIVGRIMKGADVSGITKPHPMYGDFTDLPDLRSAMVAVVKANEMFMSLDAFVRERFANDPARLLDFLGDPKNYDEGVKLGLIEPKPEVVEPPVVAPISAAKAGSGAKSSKPKVDDE